VHIHCWIPTEELIENGVNLMMFHAFSKGVMGRGSQFYVDWATGGRIKARCFTEILKGGDKNPEQQISSLHYTAD